MKPALLALAAAALLAQQAARGPAPIRFTNVAEANAFVRRAYRKGWEIPGLS